MSKVRRARPPLAFVRPAPSGEDPDFCYRFRMQRRQRWSNGIHNGMNVWSMLRYRTGLSPDLQFCGVRVDLSADPGVCRTIEDIWMRGEYDLPGFVPQSGWQVIDIGANVGIYTMLAASRGAQVIAYEPYPASFMRLVTHTAKWNVACHNTAVVGRPVTATKLFLHERHTRHTVVPESASKAAGTVDVKAIHIDNVLAKPCDLLKIDCEGCEFELINAVGSRLRMAARIIMEIHEAAGDPAQLAEQIRHTGFDVDLQEPYPDLPFVMLTALRC